MYESFHGLREKPFELHPDPEYLYMSRGHENAYTHLEYAIWSHKGFVIITGEIGSGKTTLINYLLTKIQQDTEVGLISNTSLSPEEFIMVLCEEFEVPLDPTVRDKSKMIASFHEFLLDRFAKNKWVILIIDEAQNLTSEVLEELRMLSNLETEKHHLLQTILVGQPELKTKMQAKKLEQFAQRITVHCHLNGLGRPEMEEYIRYRLKVAGAQDDNIFSADAIDAIYAHSRGIPRLINILCDTALVFGYADSIKHVNEDVIDKVVMARRAGGLFAENEQKAGLRPDDPLLEKRVRRLEAIMVGFKRRIDLLSNDKQKRDDVVLELFQLLKEDLKSRNNMPGVSRASNQKVLPSESEAPQRAERLWTFSLFRRWIFWLIIILVVIVGIAAFLAIFGNPVKTM